MTRTQRAAILDRLEIEAATTRGKIARAHNRPLGGALEPKHASPELAEAFRHGWDLMADEIEDADPKDADEIKAA